MSVGENASRPLSAVILAAGQGKRLQPFTKERNKCLLEFGGKSLLHFHLENLARAGIKEITVVVGYREGLVRQEISRIKCDVPVRTILNPRYQAGSGLSLLGAQEVFASGQSLIMDADLLYDGRLLARLVDAPAGNCLLADPHLSDSGEEVKAVLNENGHLQELGKTVLSKGRIAGESVGIFKFDHAAGMVLSNLLQRATELNPGIEYEPVISQLAKQIPIRCIFTDGLAWIEIDFPEDVERARREIYPKISPTLLS